MRRFEKCLGPLVLIALLVCAGVFAEGHREENDGRGRGPAPSCGSRLHAMKSVSVSLAKICGSYYVTAKAPDWQGAITCTDNGLSLYLASQVQNPAGFVLDYCKTYNSSSTHIERCLGDGLSGLPDQTIVRSEGTACPQGRAPSRSNAAVIASIHCLEAVYARAVQRIDSIP